MRALAWLHTPIPLIALGMLWSAASVLGRSLSPCLCVAAMSGAWVVYLLDRGWNPAGEDWRNHPARSAWLAAHATWIQGLVLLCLLNLVVCLPSLPGRTQAGLLLYVPVGLAYVRPLLPGRRRIKDVPYLKTLVILSGWTLCPLLLPGGASHAGMGGWLVYRACYILPNLLCSDWRDRTGDEGAGLATVVHHLSSLQFRLLCTASLLAASIIALCSAQPAWRLDGCGALAFLLLFWLPATRQHVARIADLYLLWPLAVLLLS